MAWGWRVPFLLSLVLVGLRALHPVASGGYACISRTEGAEAAAR